MVEPRLMRYLYSRLATEGSPVALICYAIMVVVALFVSLVLFMALLTVLSPAKACAMACAIVLLFSLVAYIAPSANMISVETVPSLQLVRRCTCGLTDPAIGALPTFSPAATEKGGAGGDEQHPQLLCAVCLEDVREGDMVRQLPPCSHLFHVECIDLWLCMHRTCPLCRCELSPRKVASKSAVATVSSSLGLPMPPV